jgi:hypothetical protein
VGGLSVVGVIALIGFAIADDTGQDTITTPTAPTILAPLEPSETDAPADSAETTSTVATTTPGETDTSATDDTQSSEPASTDAPGTTATPTTSPTVTTDAPPSTEPTLPPDEREAVRVRVVNGGGPEGGARFVTGVLEGAGFVPDGPGDAVIATDETTVLYAPGQELAASVVGDVVEAAADRVLVAPEDDNWVEFGSDLDVLVVIGPQ